RACTKYGKTTGYPGAETRCAKTLRAPGMRAVARNCHQLTFDALVRRVTSTFGMEDIHQVVVQDCHHLPPCSFASTMRGLSSQHDVRSVHALYTPGIFRRTLCRTLSSTRGHIDGRPN